MKVPAICKTCVLVVGITTVQGCPLMECGQCPEFSNQIRYVADYEIKNKHDEPTKDIRPINLWESTIAATSQGTTDTGSAPFRGL